MSPAQAREIALAFPGAYEKPSYGTPAFFVGKKLFTQVNSHGSKDIMLLTQSFEERDHLLAADPKTFCITDHFRNCKGLLARIHQLDAKTFRALLERRWQAIAPKKLLNESAKNSPVIPSERRKAARWSSSASIRTTQASKCQRR